MDEIFAYKITIFKLLGIEDFEIPLSETERKHLIVTGKNGSGKTTLLNDLRYFLEHTTKIEGNEIGNAAKHLEVLISNKQDGLNADEQVKTIHFNEEYFEHMDAGISETTSLLKQSINAFLSIKNQSMLDAQFFNGHFILAFFDAKRQKKLTYPSGISKIAGKEFYTLDDSAGADFIQYMVNLKADQAFARDAGELESAHKTDDWFKTFEQSLSELFESEIALQFDRKNYNFNIIEEGKPAYNLNQLSDGYSAILSIVTELIMRMEQHKVKNYDVQGIVLIDEVETHLHVSLQKKILPFLTKFFPRIQFIVTTHSPFVITSLANAVICDLEQRTVTDDLSAYSYEAIIESYFDVDQYSELLKKDVARYELLMDNENPTPADAKQLAALSKKLHDVPKFAADELAVKIQQIDLKHIKRKSA
jgi:AAA15 family ATPase/GTPase